jgi:hypothetical protein
MFDETESVRECKRAWFTPHHIILIAMWLITTVSLIFMLYNGVRSNFQFYSERNFLHVGYAVALLWRARAGKYQNPPNYQKGKWKHSKIFQGV